VDVYAGVAIGEALRRISDLTSRLCVAARASEREGVDKSPLPRDPRDLTLPVAVERECRISTSAVFTVSGPKSHNRSKRQELSGLLVLLILISMVIGPATHTSAELPHLPPVVGLGIRTPCL